MGPTLTQDVSAAALAAYDMIIDVRSPGEFAEDHVPGAVNLPVLSDGERAEIGATYVQDSRFRARLRGAAYVARNIAAHLETRLADRDGAFRPLIYCWRGGMRSNAMATVLSQVGWRVQVLEGGYRTYRRVVTARLYDSDLPHRFLLLDGPTGTGKTDLLRRAAARGVQVLDLEGLAAHRGSLLGGFADRPQPSQKLFESDLLAALEGLDPSRPVLAEAESSKIGDRMIPPAIWARMASAPTVELAAAPERRAAYLVETYRDIIADPDALGRTLERLPMRPSPARLVSWRAMLSEGRPADLAQALMQLHYDPAYARSRGKHDRTRLAAIELDPSDQTSLEAAADQVAGLIAALDDGL